MAVWRQRHCLVLNADCPISDLFFALRIDLTILHSTVVIPLNCENQSKSVKGYDVTCDVRPIRRIIVHCGCALSVWPTFMKPLWSGPGVKQGGFFCRSVHVLPGTHWIATPLYETVHASISLDDQLNFLLHLTFFIYKTIVSQTKSPISCLMVAFCGATFVPPWCAVSPSAVLEIASFPYPLWFVLIG